MAVSSPKSKAVSDVDSNGDGAGKGGDGEGDSIPHTKSLPGPIRIKDPARIWDRSKRRLQRASHVRLGQHDTNSTIGEA